ncbi:VP5 [Gokushovirus WZ-2015a]|nr:VP5 [Gokushovirus WZ-2015a]
MKNVLIVIYDEVAKLYSSPLTFQNIEAAKRYFRTLMLKNDTPSDFKLYQIGEVCPQANDLTEYLQVNLEFVESGVKSKE